jgi:hypothetical protein
LLHKSEILFKLVASDPLRTYERYNRREIVEELAILCISKWEIPPQIYDEFPVHLGGGPETQSSRE